MFQNPWVWSSVFKNKKSHSDTCFFESYRSRWNRFWWRMLKTKCVGDNFNMLVIVVDILATKNYISVRHQHSKDVTKIKTITKIQKMSPTLSHQHHYHRIFNEILSCIIWFDSYLAQTAAGKSLIISQNHMQEHLKAT